MLASLSACSAIRRMLLVGLVAFAGGLAGACSPQDGHGMATATSQPSLYDRLGGQPAITAVVDDFVANVAADPRINQRFADTDIPRLKHLLVEQICQASGGPCTYTGRDMRTTHAGMRITETEFNALVADLVKSLDKFKVGAQEQQELLAALGGMKADIVDA